MPQMNETGMLAMVLICLVGFVLYSIVVILPCWIIAKRKNIAPRWWNWVIPVWNLYIAFRIGNGSLKKLFLSLVFFLAGIGAFALQDQAQFFAIAGIVLFVLSLVVGIYVAYNWLRNMSILAERHPMLLPMVMLVIPCLLALVGGALVSQGVISPMEVRGSENLISFITWIIFMIVALRTPRSEPSEPDFILGKE